MFSTRSAAVKPRSLLRPWRTLSPSSMTVWTPRACSFASTRLAIVDLPAPDRPVNHRIAGRWCLSARARLAGYRQVVAMDIGRAAQAVGDHARRRGFVGEAVDQDEGAGLAVVGIGIEGDRHRRREIAEADLVERQRLGGELLQRVDVDAMLQFGDRRGRRLGADLHEIGAAGQQLLRAHPDDMRGELIGDFRPRVGLREHVAARDVDFVGERPASPPRRRPPRRRRRRRR